MNMELHKQITEQQLRTDLISFRVGNTINVSFKIIEGGKQRIQDFTGLVLKIQGSGIAKTFTIRKLNGSTSIERTFPLHSPLINKITVLKIGRVRRSKLYYMRDRIGKSARLKEVIDYKRKNQK